MKQKRRHSNFNKREIKGKLSFSIIYHIPFVHPENMRKILDNKTASVDLEPCAEAFISHEERERMRAIEKQLLLDTLKMLDMY